MCKRKFLLTSFILLLVGAPSVFGGPVGVFDFTADVGYPNDNPLGIGHTQYVLADQYLITAGGSDIWDDHDHFHYAFNEVSGDVRVSASPTWQDSGWNDWAKAAVMLRETLDTGSVHYSSSIRKGPGSPWETLGKSGDGVFFQRRESTGGGSGTTDWWGAEAAKIGIQRVTSGGYEVVQALVDQGGGAGWEAVGTMLRDLPDDLLAGVAVTAHDNAWMVQARISNVEYDYDPGLIGITAIPPDAKVEQCDTDIPGFLVRTIKAGPGTDMSGDYSVKYAKAEYLLENRELGGIPGVEEGSRNDTFVNLHDTGGRFLFDNDRSFPGIDPFMQPSDQPGNDDDNDFVTEVLGCIELTAGLHVVGGQSDDGVLIRIGGVEIGRTGSWSEVADYLFMVEVAGKYELQAIMFEGGGGADLEMYEILTDGTRILLNDVAAGGSPVFVPEPATIALLGFGGLAMLRIRKKR